MNPRELAERICGTATARASGVFRGRVCARFGVGGAPADYDVVARRRGQGAMQGAFPAQPCGWRAKFGGIMVMRTKRNRRDRNGGEAEQVAAAKGFFFEVQQEVAQVAVPRSLGHGLLEGASRPCSLRGYSAGS